MDKKMIVWLKSEALQREVLEEIREKYKDFCGKIEVCGNFQRKIEENKRFC